jgi:V/A-type H+-transporting ATPase subunit C
MANSYAYAVARIRVLETRLLSREQIERLIEADSPAEVLRSLGDSRYASYIAEGGESPDFEAMLDREALALKRLMDEITPDPVLTGAFFLTYDYHNLKVYVKRQGTGHGEEGLISLAGTIPPAKLKDAVANHQYGDLHPAMRRGLEAVDEQTSLAVDPQRTDTILDQALYRQILDSLGRGRDHAFVRQLFIDEIDRINLRTLLRVKRDGSDAKFLSDSLLPGGSVPPAFWIQALDVPLELLAEEAEVKRLGEGMAAGIRFYEKTGRMTELERRMDMDAMKKAHAARHNPFGIEPIVGYIQAVENELKLIRLIMVAKANRIPEDKLRERLRDVYA